MHIFGNGIESVHIGGDWPAGRRLCATRSVARYRGVRFPGGGGGGEEALSSSGGRGRARAARTGRRSGGQRWISAAGTPDRDPRARCDPEGGRGGHSTDQCVQQN